MYISSVGIAFYSLLPSALWYNVAFVFYACSLTNVRLKSYHTLRRFPDLEGYHC